MQSPTGRALEMEGVRWCSPNQRHECADDPAERAGRDSDELSVLRILGLQGCRIEVHMRVYVNFYT